MNSIKLEILKYNYEEHFKIAKDLAFVLPIDHPRRKMIERELNKLQTEIHRIQNENKSTL